MTTWRGTSVVLIVWENMAAAVTQLWSCHVPAVRLMLQSIIPDTLWSALVQDSKHHAACQILTGL